MKLLRMNSKANLALLALFDRRSKIYMPPGKVGLLSNLHPRSVYMYQSEIEVILTYHKDDPEGRQDQAVIGSAWHCEDMY